jgi:hypothetical protein
MTSSLRALPAALALTFALAACDSTASGPGSALPAQFSSQISLPDLQSHLLTGPTRVDVRVIPGTLVARRVQIEAPEELARPEEVRSRVSAISATADQGTVTLELGGLQIAFDASTRFRPDDGDGSEHDAMMSDDHGGATPADFVARVQAELAAGRHPAVKARRAPPATPQAPDDAAFLATELRLDQENDHPHISLNVTDANLTTNPTPPPDGTLRLLGLSIELRVSDGTTTLHAEHPDLEGQHEFAGLVQSVDGTANSVTFVDGTIVRLSAGTMIEAKEGERDDGHLASLADVQAALAAGRTVKAEGEGLVASTTPLTIDAVEIEFETEETGAQQP